MTNFEKMMADPQYEGMTTEKLVEFIPCEFCKYADMYCLSDEKMKCVDGFRDWLEMEADSD